MTRVDFSPLVLVGLSGPNGRGCISPSDELVSSITSCVRGSSVVRFLTGLTGSEFSESEL